MYDCLLLKSERRIDVSAIVQAHDYVASIAHLQLNSFLWRKVKLAISTFRLEGNAVVIQSTKFRVLLDQRISLEAAGIGNDRPVPGAHGMQSTQCLNRRRAGALHQVKCIHDH